MSCHGPIRKTIAGTPLRMLAYNGSIPGPLLRVQQGTTVTVEVANDAGLEQTVHWHGLRLDNRSDGVPYETQQPIRPASSSAANCGSPTPACTGTTHTSERTTPRRWACTARSSSIRPAPTTGLSGQPGHRVDPRRPAAPRRTDRRVSSVRPHSHDDGRFGTVLLINGQTDASFDVKPGEVVRLYLTNTANTRVFNVAIMGATLKLIGGDSGRYEQEEFVESVLLSPSERAIVDVLFDHAGTAVLEHRTPDHASTLATFHLAAGEASPSFIDAYRVLRTDPELEAERAGLAAHADRPPDKTLQFIGEMDMSGRDMSSIDMSGMDMSAMDMGSMDMGTTEMGSKDMSDMDMSSMDMGGRHGNEAHDMHGHGMHQMSSQPDPTGMHHQDLAGEDAHSIPPPEADAHIEWEDTMPEMNVMSNLSNMVWKVVDTATGAANNEISWTLHVGDRVKVRLDNSAGADHQMHHPFHIRGAGRFLVLDRGGASETKPGMEGHRSGTGR
jgi:FtsP/CotA-like multicopper oxidase with cupredoxin domain